MRRKRTTEPMAHVAGAATTPNRVVPSSPEPWPLVAFDPALGVHPVFVDLPRVEVVYFRLVVESWEHVAIPRTVQRWSSEDRERCLVVVLVVPDFVEPALRWMARLAAEVDARPVVADAQMLAELRLDLLADSPGDAAGDSLREAGR